jgi:hypothetical protein
MTAFQGAVDATFAEFGIDALYTPAGGEPVSVRVIARRPDTIVGFGETRIHAETGEHRFGPLRFVSRQSGPSLLVDGLRASFSRKSGALQGFRRPTDRARERGEGLTMGVMFLLVPQVKLPKRLDITRAAERWSGQLPTYRAAPASE